MLYFCDLSRIFASLGNHRRSSVSPLASFSAHFDERGSSHIWGKAEWFFAAFAQPRLGRKDSTKLSMFCVFRTDLGPKHQTLTAPFRGLWSGVVAGEGGVSSSEYLGR